MTTRCSALSFLILSLLSSTYGSAIEPRGTIEFVFPSNNYVSKFGELKDWQTPFILACGGFLYVGDEDVIEAPFQENCEWQIQTDEKYVLAFSLVHGGDFAAAQEFFSVSIWICRQKYFSNYSNNCFPPYSMRTDSWRTWRNPIGKSNTSQSWSYKRRINHHGLHQQFGGRNTFQEDTCFTSKAQNSKGIIVFQICDRIL